MGESNTWSEYIKSVSIGGEMGEFKVHDRVATGKTLVIVKEVSTIKGNLVCYKTIGKELCGESPIGPIQ